MGILRKLIFVIVFLLSTLSFLVIFENGFSDFGTNLGNQITDIQKMVTAPLEKKKE